MAKPCSSNQNPCVLFLFLEPDPETLQGPNMGALCPVSEKVLRGRSQEGLSRVESSGWANRGN